MFSMKRICGLFVFTFLFTQAFFSVNAQNEDLNEGEQPSTTGEVKTHDVIFFDENKLELENGMLTWEEQVSIAGSNFMRIGLKNITPCKACKYKLEFFDSEYKLVETMRDDFLSNKSQVWSHLIDGDVVYLKVSIEPDAIDLTFSFTISEVVGSIKKASLQSYLNDPPLFKSTYALPDSKKSLARSVGRVDYKKSGKNKTCTGFLVGDSLLLTNHHCINDPIVCTETTSIEFSHELSNKDGLTFNSIKGRCTGIRALSKKLDFALLDVKLDQNIAPLDICKEKVLANDALLSIQHPNGRLKEFTQCNVERIPVRGGRNVTELVDLSLEAHY